MPAASRRRLLRQCWRRISRGSRSRSLGCGSWRAGCWSGRGGRGTTRRRRSWGRLTPWQRTGWGSRSRGKGGRQGGRRRAGGGGECWRGGGAGVGVEGRRRSVIELAGDKGQVGIRLGFSQSVFTYSRYLFTILKPID